MSTPTTKITSIPKSSGEKKWLIPLLLALIAALMITNLYLAHLYTNASQKSVAGAEKMHNDSLTLSNTYLLALDSLNRQKTENTVLNEYVEDLKGGLSQIYDEIGIKMKSGMSDADLRIEMDRLLAQMRSGVKEIEALRKDKVALQQKVEQIRKEKEMAVKIKEQTIKERDSLGTDAAAKEVKLREEAAAAAAAAEATKKAADEISAYESQIANASFVAVSNISLLPQNQKRRNKVETTSKASRIDFYKFCFKTAVNPLINKGRQTFYLRLLTEGGEPVQIGSEETKANGQPVRYAKSITVDYDGTSKDHCLDWKPDEKLRSGKYTIDVFNNNKLVGQSSLILK